MSAKWRALQHKHRYTYTAVSFPQPYLERLNSLPSDVLARGFFVELEGLISLNSIYAQVSAAKKLATSFIELLGNAEEDLVEKAARLYLEILFFENSLPLHRTLVSILAKARNYQSVIANSFLALCDVYGALGGKGKRFVVSRVALSMMGCPKLGFLVEIVDMCSISVALDVAFGLNAVVSEVNNGSRPSPLVMEQCQEALSCSYYLFQRFPSRFVDLEKCQVGLSAEDESSAIEIVVKAILGILKSPAYSRDCLVAAGVSFCAALQVCLGPEELAQFIVKCFFRNNYTQSEFGVPEQKLPYKGDLYLEIGNFSVLSRICLMRGILTAVPRPVLNTHFDLPGSGNNGFEGRDFGGNSIWTILFDGILPELCNYCENPVDSHFNFHVLTVMQICLQQIKASVSADLVNISKNYTPLTEDMGNRILRIIWDNLEDPLNQTVKQVHLVFDLFLDIQSTLHANEGSDRIKSVLQKTASDLLLLGSRCKGRYVPLASLTKRLGAKTILSMSPNLLFETIHGYIDDDVCCAATSFLKCFLGCLRDECWSSDGIERGYALFRGHCLPPIMYGLISGVSKLRSNLNTYAISVVLEVDVDSIFPMLNFISVGKTGEDTELGCPELATAKIAISVDQQVAALVSLLKVSRSLAFIEGDIDMYSESSTRYGLKIDGFDVYAIVCIKGVKLNVPVKWLVLALTHVDETLRIDAAESLFMNPKTASLPSNLELSLLKEAMPLNMRCCSTGFQMKWTSLFRKFFSRVRTALERQLKQGCLKPLISSDVNIVEAVNSAKEAVSHRAEDLFEFMKWLSSFLFFSCYPSAPYERKIMAMELILIMMNTWPVISPSQGKCDSNSASCLYPYNEGFTSPDSTLLLVGSIVDSWDRLRENSFRILLHFPTPLPGISSEDRIREAITWAKKLVCSPRVRESDAGALTLRLIFRKYVLDLGWMIGASVDVVCFSPQSLLPNGATQKSKSEFPLIEYILSLIDWLHASVNHGEKDLSEACRNSSIHGVLLTLRYTFEEMDWNSDVALSSRSEMRTALNKLLELLMRITSLALWVVSADAWHLPEDMDDMDCEDAFVSDVVDMTVPECSSEHHIKNEEPVETVRPSEQVIMVGCWLAMKEVSLLLGTITRKVPLPSCPSSDAEATDVLPMVTSDEILDLGQLEAIGNHFLEVLLKMKHNGAIDKTRAGFAALCNRLLCSNDPRLCQMTESWMDQLMERTVATGQTVDDLLRRSAGIPAAFIALFLSEPEGAPKKLLPRAMRWLVDVATVSLPNPAVSSNCDSGAKSSTNANQAPICALPAEMSVCEMTSKVRDEGVIPTVHAFNVLRAAFNDTNLATDTSGFCADAMILSIRSFSSPYWEVRNSACLAYTALVRRMIGFLNLQKRESIRRALTALEFFHRYPSLHSFLFNELKIATQLLGDGSSEHLESNIAKVVHPSLCPVLILLSRLKPSTMSCETEDPLDPFLFMPFIRRCSTQSNFRVRVLASRALTGLVSNEKLPNVLHNIACGLPYMRNQATVNSLSSGMDNTSEGMNSSFNSIHGTLLQLSSFVDVNCRNLTDVLKKDHILGDLIQVLITVSWIGSPKLCRCSTLNCSYLQLLDKILSIVRTCRLSKHIGAIRTLLTESSLQCLDFEVSHKTAFHDPTKAELRRQAAVSYFSCVFQADSKVAEDFRQTLQNNLSPGLDLSREFETEGEISGIEERLILSISDPSYEVRLASLKWLLRFLKSTRSAGNNRKSCRDIGIVNDWAKTNLQPILMQLLATEDNPRCTCNILRVLFVWNLIQFQKPDNQLCKETIYVGSMDFESVFQFWNQLTSLSKVVRHKKIQEALICCLGICVKRFISLFRSSVLLDVDGKKIINFSELDQSEKWTDCYGCICAFVGLVKQHSAASEPVNMRKAAADSMVASGLLEEAGKICFFVSNTRIPSEEHCSFMPSEAANMYGQRILDLWFICIKLLEDEDDALRESLAEDVQRCFASKGSETIHQTSMVPTQVERVIELSFEFLSSIFSHWVVYFDYLARSVLSTAAYMVTQGDLVRRVFDKEIDNHHEEKLMICQICCFHLEKLLLSKSWGVGLQDHELVLFLQKWRTRFYHHLTLFAYDYLQAEGGVDWIGGAGNHKDVFKSLYANLLGLYALSQCIFSRESEICLPRLSDLVELEGTIRPFLRNPLISNLYLSVIQLHEKVFDVQDSLGPKSGRPAIWDGFDPYFLLR